jgi:hypothetical protein
MLHMSMSAAIQAAVWKQLVTDNRPLPSTGQEVMGTTYRYNATTIRSFLFGIATQLAADTPKLEFQWTDLNTDACLTDTVITLCGLIATATS